MESLASSITRHVWNLQRKRYPPAMALRQILAPPVQGRGGPRRGPAARARLSTKRAWLRKWGAVRARWDQTAWPPATHTIFLWITDKGFARLEAIWSAWTQHALLPAFFTTVETLSLGTGRLWHPWNPRRHLPDGHSVWVWHDMYGRPRSLRPWDLEEEVLRFEQPVAVQARSLGESLNVLNRK